MCAYVLCSPTERTLGAVSVNDRHHEVRGGGVFVSLLSREGISLGFKISHLYVSVCSKRNLVNILLIFPNHSYTLTQNNVPNVFLTHSRCSLGEKNDPDLYHSDKLYKSLWCIFKSSQQFHNFSWVTGCIIGNNDWSHLSSVSLRKTHGWFLQCTWSRHHHHLFYQHREKMVSIFLLNLVVRQGYISFLKYYAVCSIHLINGCGNL